MVSPAPPEGFSKLAIRVTTALLIGGVILVAIIFGKEPGLGALVAFIAMACVMEFYAMTRRERRLPNEIFGVFAVVLMPLAAALWGRLGLMSVVTGLVLASLLWHVAFRQVRVTDTAVTVFGAVYVGFMFSHLVLIRGLDSGTELALVTVVSVWANDVFAYFVGSTLGRHKMTPRISPNKSWEGFAAGTLFTTAVWAALPLVIDTGISTLWLVLTGVSVSFAAVIGDLAESRLKREAGIKDSGALLPGHGGFLDRFDSLIFVSVVAYYMLVCGGAR
jgi:phosphatidate cytidylyltransferase